MSSNTWSIYARQTCRCNWMSLLLLCFAMDSLQWHLHTFESSSYEISDDDSDWDTSSKHSYQSHLDLRSHHCCDSTDSSGPPQTALDSFLDSVLPPEDWPCDSHYLGRLNPYDSDSIAESEGSNLEEYDNEELLILNTPEALYKLYHKNKLQSHIATDRTSMSWLRSMVSDRRSLENWSLGRRTLPIFQQSLREQEARSYSQKTSCNCQWEIGYRDDLASFPSIRNW